MNFDNPADFERALVQAFHLGISDETEQAPWRTGAQLAYRVSRSARSFQRKALRHIYSAGRETARINLTGKETSQP